MSKIKFLTLGLILTMFTTFGQLTHATSLSLPKATKNHPLGYYTQQLNLPISEAPSNLSSNDPSLPSKDAVDVSSYQSWMSQNDYYQLKSQGVRTVIIKLTEGTYYTNPYAATQIEEARHAGLNIAVYHFAIFGNTNNQLVSNNAAIAEANYFSFAAKKLGIPASTIMIEDAENPNTSSAIWTQASQNFTNQLKSQTYSQVRYYTSQGWAATHILNANILGAKNFWIAQYLYGKPSNKSLKNTEYGAWQYTSQMYFINFSYQNPVDTTIDYNHMFEANSPYPDVFRLYNPNTGEHFYTTSCFEMTSLIRSGWSYEGRGWRSTKQKSGAIYRLYNPNAGNHFYTTNSYEKEQLCHKGWRYEGISFYSGGNIPVYRAYNPHSGLHNYTTNSYEQKVLLKLGWKNEGIAWNSY